jgi:hypothetical protein
VSVPSPANDLKVTPPPPPSFVYRQQDMTKFKKGDLVRVHAKEFDGERDEEGRLFSEKWAADGHGEWCYRAISRVYVRKGREAQKYRIKYDEGSSMSCLEGIIEFAPDGEESECSTVDSEREGSVSSEEDVVGDPQGEDDESENEDPGTVEEDETDNSASDEDDMVTVGGVHYAVSASKRRRGQDNVGRQAGIGGVEPIAMGERVTASGLIKWKRIEGLPEDTRTELHFDSYFKTNMFHDMTREVNVFNALLPLSKEALLEVVRKNAEESNDHNNYFLWHIDCTMALIFGGAQFKAETDLWGTWPKGMMPAPDFGRVLSRDRFKKIVRYWSRGLQSERDNLKNRPWAQVDRWVKGFNASRLREICPGSSLTPDEMMLEWKGKSGNGGLPHLSFIKRKPQPLGTELKIVCEGTFGICVFIEIQKGNIRMARKKWARTYGATTGCTLRLLDALQISELGDPNPKKRCVYADSWFASFKTDCHGPTRRTWFAFYRAH